MHCIRFFSLTVCNGVDTMRERQWKHVGEEPLGSQGRIELKIKSMLIGHLDNHEQCRMRNIPIYAIEHGSRV